MPNILIVDGIDAVCSDILKEEGFSVTQDKGLSLETIGEFDAIALRGKTKLTSEVISLADKLQIVGRAGAGVDNIDLNAASEKGIVVVNSPNSNSISVAELVFGHMLGMSRSLPGYDQAVKQGGWPKGKLPGKRELYGKTMGIIGLGNIGQEVATRAMSFGMEVAYHDPFILPPSDQHDQVSLETLFVRSDFVTVHVPKKAETIDMVTYELLSRLPPGAMLINTARPSVIVEGALEAALNERQDLLAAVDVYREEGTGEKSLARFGDRVLLTPHIGAATNDAQKRGAETVAKKFIGHFESGRTTGAVNQLEMRQHRYGKLTENIALLGCSLLASQPDEVRISCYGDLQSSSRVFLGAALKGVLSLNTEAVVDYISSHGVAQERGILSNIRTPDNNKGYGDSITVDVLAGGLKVSIRGTVDDTGTPKIIRIDDYHNVGLIPKGDVNCIIYDRSPGVLGVMGTVCGDNDTNIGYAQAHSDNGREMTLWRTDRPLDEAILGTIVSGVEERTLEGRGNVEVYKALTVSFK